MTRVLEGLWACARAVLPVLVLTGLVGACSVPLGGGAKLGVSLTPTIDGDLGINIGLSASCMGLASMSGSEHVCTGLVLAPPPAAAPAAPADGAAP